MADEARIAKMEAATARLPEAEKALKDAGKAEEKALAAYHAAVKVRKDLEAEISDCKQTLGLKVRAGGGKAKAPVEEAPAADTPAEG